MGQIRANFISPRDLQKNNKPVLRIRRKEYNNNKIFIFPTDKPIVDVNTINLPTIF